MTGSHAEEIVGDQPAARLHCAQLGALAQLGERRLCKPEVTGSIPVRSIPLDKAKTAY